MNKLLELDYRILLALVDDDERLESVYSCVNNSVYINHSTDPLYTSLYEFPAPEKYNAQEVFNHTKELIKSGYVGCLTVIKNEEEEYSPQKVAVPNFDDFSVFASYWLSLTPKGKTEINKDIYKDYYENFQRENE